MDYKLEALHKQYLVRLTIGLLTFLLSFIGTPVFLILSLIFGTTILTLITIVCCFVALVSVLAISANWVIPKWLEEAEQEYRETLARIKCEEKAKINEYRNRLAKLGIPHDYDDDLFIKRFMSEYGYIVEAIESLDKLIKNKQNVCEEKKPKQSDERKPKFAIGDKVHAKSPADTKYVYDVKEVIETPNHGFIYGFQYDGATYKWFMLEKDLVKAKK